MDPEPGELRDFPEPNILVNDDLAHPFASPPDAQTVNRLDASDSDLTFKSAQSMELDNNSETKIIQDDNEVTEHAFDNDTDEEKDQQNSFIEELIANIKSFDMNEYNSMIKKLNEKLKYLETESERAQRITTHFEK
jgi:hypothetical protein